MARDGANAEPNAYEYAGKGSPNDSDNDEGVPAHVNLHGGASWLLGSIVSE